MSTSMIIPAAGIGTRMNFPMAKQFYELLGMPVILHLLKRVDMVSEISEIIVALRKSELEGFNAIINGAGISKPVKTVIGGEARQESVRIGLKAANPESKIIMIHDAVRPLVTPNLMIESIERTKELKATVAAVQVKDTIKEVKDGVVVRTLKRDALYAIQTPQTFERGVIVEAHENAFSKGLQGTDDAALVEELDINVHLIPGSYDNIKITTYDDFAIAESILQLQKHSLHYF